MRRQRADDLRRAEEAFYLAMVEMNTRTKELERAVERLEQATDRIEGNGHE